MEILSNHYTADIEIEKKKLEIELNQKNQTNIENIKLFQPKEVLSINTNNLISSHLEVSSKFIPTMTTSTQDKKDNVDVEKTFKEKEKELLYRYEMIRKKEKEKFLLEKKDNDEKIKIQNDIELNKWKKIINIYNLKSSSDIQNQNQQYKNENFPFNGSFDGFHISPFPESVTGNEKDKTDYDNTKKNSNINHVNEIKNDNFHKDRKSTRLNSSHPSISRMPSSA